MKLFFCSYGSRHFRGALQRITDEAHRMTVFDAIFAYDEDALNPTFRTRHRKFMASRGNGYWIWKPQIVRQTLDRMEDGDVLVYADAGCVMNPGGKRRLLEYADMVRRHPSGILTFELEHRNCIWTKGDLLAAMGFDDDGVHQVAGGIFVIRKCPAAVAVVDEWLQWCERYPLIDDSPSVHPNCEGFREHRHDQSVWSILAHQKGVLRIPDETWGDFSQMRHLPIHARRLHG